MEVESENPERRMETVVQVTEPKWKKAKEKGKETNQLASESVGRELQKQYLQNH